MDRSDALAKLNGRMLAAYSRRTLLALPQGLPVRLLLARLEPVLALNVAKEVRKDAIVIRRAAEACATGAAPGVDTLQRLVEVTKAIDREFLERVRAFPVRIVIRYDDIASVRRQRIERLYGAACLILNAWNGGHKLRAALRVSFTEPELERVLGELMQLHSMEVRMLSRSVTLPALLTPLREHLALSLNAVMNEVAARLAQELARAVHHQRAAGPRVSCTS